MQQPRSQNYHSCGEKTPNLVLRSQNGCSHVRLLYSKPWCLSSSSHKDTRYNNSSVSWEQCWLKKTFSNGNQLCMLQKFLHANTHKNNKSNPKIRLHVCMCLQFQTLNHPSRRCSSYCCFAFFRYLFLAASKTFHVIALTGIRQDI